MTMSTEAKEAMKKTPGVGRPKIVCILGSTKFKVQQLAVAQRETLRGHIVLLPGFWHHVDPVPLQDGQKERVDELMLHKIDLADEVFVVNVNGYVGMTTHRGVHYAREKGKPVRWLEDPT